jgi:hypothetical protein
VTDRGVAFGAAGELRGVYMGQCFHHDLSNILSTSTTVSRTVKSRIGDALFDLMADLVQRKGFGVFVPLGQEAGDGLRGDQTEPERSTRLPRGAGRGELQMAARVGGPVTT